MPCLCQMDTFFVEFKLWWDLLMVLKGMKMHVRLGVDEDMTIFVLICFNL